MVLNSFIGSAQLCVNLRLRDRLAAHCFARLIWEAWLFVSCAYGCFNLSPAITIQGQVWTVTDSLQEAVLPHETHLQHFIREYFDWKCRYTTC